MPHIASRAAAMAKGAVETLAEAVALLAVIHSMLNSIPNAAPDSASNTTPDSTWNSELSSSQHSTLATIEAVSHGEPLASHTNQTLAQSCRCDWLLSTLSLMPQQDVQAEDAICTVHLEKHK